LNLYEYGPGTFLACSGSVEGYTAAFIPPVVDVAADMNLGDIIISWTTDTELSSTFLVLRKPAGASNSELVNIATVQGDVFSYVDEFDISDDSSPVNGASYEYCIRTYNDILDMAFDDGCDTGNSYDIGLTVTPGQDQEDVTLSWNPGIASFQEVKQLQVLRDRQIILEVEELFLPSVMEYIDASPTYGLESVYSIRVLGENGEILGADIADPLELDAIGQIKGYVRNEDNIGIKEITVSYRFDYEGVTYEGTAVTDAAGKYEIEGVIFGRAGVVEVSVVSEGQYSPEITEVALDNDEPVRENINFTSKDEINDIDEGLTIDELLVASGPDRLDFTWTYENSLGTTTFFQLYRELELIAVLDDSDPMFVPMLSDLTGQPEAHYTYELRAYAFDDAGNVISLSQEFSNRDFDPAGDPLLPEFDNQFPEVTMPVMTQLYIGTNAYPKGVASLEWVSNSENLTGFRIYRDDILIATIPEEAICSDTPQEYCYTDFEGEPGASYTYNVTAYRLFRNEICRTCESTPAVFNPVAVLPPLPGNGVALTLQSEPDNNAVSLVATNMLPFLQADDYVTGVKIYRNDEEIGELIKGGSLVFTDLKGLPGESYTYSLKSFVDRNDTTYYSSDIVPIPSTINFPDIPTPAVSVTPDPVFLFARLDIDAIYNEEKNNFDGFVAYANNVPFDTIHRYESATYFYPPSTNDADYDINIRAYREIDGAFYYSNPSNTSTESFDFPDSPVQAPINTYASENFPMHIVVSWDYPVYIRSSFEVTRFDMEGTQVGDPVILPPGTLYFYDYDAEPGEWYRYDIVAINDVDDDGAEEESSPVSVRGKRAYTGLIYGQLVSVENGRNVGCVEVQLLNGMKVLDRTFTDSTGFFLFEESIADASEMDDLKLSVQTEGRTLDVSSTAVPIIDYDPNLDFAGVFLDDFKPSVYPPIDQREEIVDILSIKSRALPNRQDAVVSWVFSEGLYDGFRVKRQLVNRSVNETEEGPYFYIDEQGTPGIDYPYAIDPFTNIDGTISTRATQAFSETTFPLLPPVENLSATAGLQSSNPNSITLQWSHPTGEVTTYQVVRNSEVIGLVEAGPDKQLLYLDDTGEPDKLYSYSVRALRNRGNQTLASTVKTITNIRYPDIATPVNFMAAPKDGDNAVELSWEYPDVEAVKFLIIRRKAGETDIDMHITIEGEDEEQAVRTYLDYTGVAEQEYEYTIQAIVTRNEMTYSSRPATDEVTFPEVVPVSNIVITENNELGIHEVSFDYSARGVASFEVDVELGNSGSLVSYPLSSISAIPDINDLDEETPSVTFSFTNSIGLSSVVDEGPTTYKIRAVALSGNMSEDSELGIAGPFPIAELENFSATDGVFDNVVKLSWELDPLAEVDSITIERKIEGSPDFTELVRLSGTERSYLDVFNDIAEGGNDNIRYQYQITVYKKLSNQEAVRSITLSDFGYANISRQVPNYLTGQSTTGRFGHSVAAYENKLVVGDPSYSASLNPAGSASFFHKGNDEWVSDEFITGDFDCSFSNDCTEQLGYAVDIHNDRVIIGAPRSSNSGGSGRIQFYDFDEFGNVTFFGDYRNTDDNMFTRIGEYVSVSSNTHYWSSADPNPSVPTLSFFVQNSDNLNNIVPVDFGPDSRQRSTAHPAVNNGEYLIFSSPNYASTTGATEGQVGVWKKENPTPVNPFNPDSYSRVGNLSGNVVNSCFGCALAIADEGDINVFVLGSPDENDGEGAIRTYNISDNSISQIQTITPPNIGFSSESGHFGKSLDFDGEYLIVGAPDHGVEGVQEGVAFVYKYNGASFDYVDYLSVPDLLDENEQPFISESDFGFDVAVSEQGFFVGAPNASFAGNVFYYGRELLELWQERLTNVTASDGTSAAHVRVEWDFDGNRQFLSDNNGGFEIYRIANESDEGNPIASLGSNVTFYLDTEASPGTQYTYVVKVKVEDKSSPGKADNGFRNNDGRLEGDVISAEGNGVPGVHIEAFGVDPVTGKPYSYEAETTDNGHFVINNVFYPEGTEGIDYKLTASFGNHLFAQNPLETNLSENTPVSGANIFVDLTAFVIEGNVRFADVACPIEGLEVKAIYLDEEEEELEGINEISALTDENGDYALVINPMLPGLATVRVKVADRRKVDSPESGEEVTFLHQFETSSVDLQIDDMDQWLEEQHDFEDTYKYNVELSIATVCGVPASSTGEFNLQVTTLDGCYLKEFETGIAPNATNTINLELPSLEGLLIRVNGTTVQNTPNLLIADYLRARPLMLDLLSVHLDKIKEAEEENQENQLTIDDLEPMPTLSERLLYHKPATIEIQDNFETRVSCEDESPAIRYITQDGGPYVLEFNVVETHAGFGDPCPVDEGYLLITNAAALEKTSERIDYSENGFAAHFFEAGEPNIVVPFLKGINVKYFSANDDLLAERNIAVVVEGTAALEGFDVNVSPAQEGDNVLLPVYVLRDPPGDGSYSYIQEGTSIQKNLTLSRGFSGGGGLLTDNAFAVGIGFFLQTSTLGGGGKRKSNEFGLEFTTQQEISTSNTSDFTGADADVIVGVGLATQYGISEELFYDEESCKYEKRQIFAIQPNSIDSEWFYTVGQIKQFVTEKYAQLSGLAVDQGYGLDDLVDFGLPEENLGRIDLNAQAFAFEDAEGNEADFEDAAGEPVSAANKLIAEIQNWEQVLLYHRQETNPFYMFCAETYDEDELWGQMINLWLSKDASFLVSRYGGENRYIVRVRDNIELYGDDQDVPSEEEIEELAEEDGSLSELFVPVGIRQSVSDEFASRVNVAITVQEQFCTTIGTYNDNDGNREFELNYRENNPELGMEFINNDIAIGYDKATKIVSLYLDSLQLDAQEVADRKSSIEVEENPAFNEGFLPEIENTTFSGGVNINKSVTTRTSNSSSIEQTRYFEFSASGGFLAETEISTSFFVIEKKLFSQTNKIGVQAKINYEWGKSFVETVETESTTGYVLSDDDPGDQFSVTAIKGRDAGHTPYFQLLGGRASCPPEDGAILRDQFQIDLIDPETGAAEEVQSQIDVDPDEPASFLLQLTNLNPFGEQRDFYVYQDNNSNTNGARLKLDGVPLPGGNQGGAAVYTFVNPNEPIITLLTLERAPGLYQHEDINIILRPSCTDGDLFLLGERDTVTISATFEHPCSDVTIMDPGPDWLISRRNPLIPGSEEELDIEIRDYEADNPNLMSIDIQVRRVGFGEAWQSIPISEFAPEGLPDLSNGFDKEFLQAYNEAEFGDGDIPKLFLNWRITDDISKYPDGDYEIRVEAFCGVAGSIYSNVIPGRIFRNDDDLLAVTSPPDGGIWTQADDEISITFTEPINCSDFPLPDFQVSVLGSDPLVLVEGTIQCFDGLGAENKLVFIPDNISAYDGEILQATVTNIRDEVGEIFYELDNQGNIAYEVDDQTGALTSNPIPKTFTWQFEVFDRDLQFLDRTIEWTVYAGQTDIRTTSINNTTAATIDFMISEAVFDSEVITDFSWLTVDAGSDLLADGETREIELMIDASDPDELPLGESKAKLLLQNDNGDVEDVLEIIVKVLAQPPNWVVPDLNYGSDVTVIADYEFTSPPNGYTKDEADLISAWIGNEIRGVASIEEFANGTFSAAISVAGDLIVDLQDGNVNVISDAGKTIEFRVWDADQGKEYNATPVSPLSELPITYQAGERYGSFAMPVILSVNRSKDMARYIPVNGSEDGGTSITWFSINSKEEDRSVDAQLRELQFLQNGDIIKTGESIAVYTTAFGWQTNIGAPNVLSNLEPEEGYILILQGKDDSIRITGVDADYTEIPLVTGWNLIGYPLQEELDINIALPGLSFTDNAEIRTLPLGQATFSTDFSILNLLDNVWEGEIETLQPNFAYQLKVGAGMDLCYPECDSSSPFSGNDPVNDSGSVPAFNPSDPTTWSVDPTLYPGNMVVFGALEFDGELSVDKRDKIAAFVNGECRGVTSPQYSEAFGHYVAPLFVYNDYEKAAEVQFLLYDASEEEVYISTEPLSYKLNDIIGSYPDPYVFRNKERAAVYQVDHTYCEADNTGAIHTALVTGLQPPLSYGWSTGITAPSAKGLTAGSYKVTITGQLGLSIVDEIQVDNKKINLPAPAVESTVDNPACVGADAVLYAMPPESQYSIQWYDADGNWLQDGEALLLENIQKTYTALVRTNFHGCLSEPQEATIEVYQPVAGFSILPDQEITTETKIQFQLPAEFEGYTYQWHFGDGKASTERVPQHQYKLPGLYTSSLVLTDERGCTSNTVTHNIWVDAASNTLSTKAGEMSIDVSPNPFSYQLNALVEVPEAGRYSLAIHDMSGQLIRSNEYDWEIGKQNVLLEVDAADGVYLISCEHPSGAKVVIPIVKQAIRP